MFFLYSRRAHQVIRHQTANVLTYYFAIGNLLPIEVNQRVAYAKQRNSILRHLCYFFEMITLDHVFDHVRHYFQFCIS